MGSDTFYSQHRANNAFTPDNYTAVCASWFHIENSIFAQTFFFKPFSSICQRVRRFFISAEEKRQVSITPAIIQQCLNCIK